MDIEEIKVKKEELEKDILDLLCTFKKETGIAPTDLTLEGFSDHIMGSSRFEYTLTRVSVEIRL